MVAPSASWSVFDLAIKARQPFGGLSQMLNVERDELGAAEGPAKAQEKQRILEHFCKTAASEMARKRTRAEGPRSLGVWDTCSFEAPS
ncbi:DNA repair protein RadC [Bradyrhizobium sp. CIR3A]|nr:DNA repair protein RadC [Bradyrhizobium sp. CIR3A]